MSEKERLFQSISRNPLFLGLSDAQMEKITRMAKYHPLNANAILMREGQESEDFYLLESGSLEISKKGTEKEMAFSSLAPGDAVGELALIGDHLRSATVRAKEASNLIRINIKNLNSDPEIFTIISKNLNKRLAAHLHRSNEITVEALEKELERTKLIALSGRFIITIIVLLVSFTFALEVLTKATRNAGIGIWFTAPSLAIIFALLVREMKRSEYPARFFGLTLHNWRPALFYSFLFSLPILLLTLVAKWFLIEYVEKFHGMPLFSLGQSVSTKSSLSGIFLLGIIYVFFSSPIQECIFRGGLQSLFQNFLMGKHRILLSLIVSNLLFAIVHLQFSAIFSAIAFFGGLFWGWLYYRFNNLIAPIFSHMLIGFWALFILGIQTVVTHG